MGKRASNSGKTATSATSLPGETPSTSRKILLRAQNSTEIEGRPNSTKRPKLSSKKTTKKKNIDSSKPKKPPTAFFYFLEDFRRGYQEENPHIKMMRDIGKACGEKWKTMTYEEKVKYYDTATEKRAEFDKAMSEYIRKKESGEDALSEDSDSESDIY